MLAGNPCGAGSGKHDALGPRPEPAPAHKKAAGGTPPPSHDRSRPRECSLCQKATPSDLEAQAEVLGADRHQRLGTGLDGSLDQISKPRPKSSALIAISGSAPASMAPLWARVRGSRRW